MKQKKKSSRTINPKQVTSCVAYVEKAYSPFADTTRMTADDRRRSLKLKRGAREVITTIAQLADKYGVVPPGVSLDEMLSNIEDARTVEPLMQEADNLYETVRDIHLRSQSNAWKTASVTYGMLAKAAEVNQRLRTDLEPVVRWFRASGGKGGSTAAPVDATAPTAVTK